MESLGKTTDSSAVSGEPTTSSEEKNKNTKKVICPKSSLSKKSQRKRPKKDDDGEPDMCPICLDPPVHPVKLACKHVFCFLCAKGLVESDGNAQCSLCRKKIKKDFLAKKSVVRRSRSDLASGTTGVNQWQWFYEGNQGWWKFEHRCNEDIEAAHGAGRTSLDLLICGHVYVIDLQGMAQYRKDMPSRKRKIKRDAVLAQCKGVAGLVPKN